VGKDAFGRIRGFPGKKSFSPEITTTIKDGRSGESPSTSWIGTAKKPAADNRRKLINERGTVTAPPNHRLRKRKATQLKKKRNPRTDPLSQIDRGDGTKEDRIIERRTNRRLSKKVVEIWKKEKSHPRDSPRILILESKRGVKGRDG